jgi:hypothetical protein
MLVIVHWYAPWHAAHGRCHTTYDSHATLVYRRDDPRIAFYALKRIHLPGNHCRAQDEVDDVGEE